MVAASKIHITLKVFIHKHEERVLYVEANSDFVDILFSFLTMPMGTIVRLLSKLADSSQQPEIGSLNNVHKSIANLETKYFATGACKDILLNTRNSAEAECRKLKINVDDISPVSYYTCEDMSCTENGYTAFFSMYYGVQCKNCSKASILAIDGVPGIYFSLNKWPKALDAEQARDRESSGEAKGREVNGQCGEGRKQS